MEGESPPAKTGAERVAALRASRYALGLRRLELYAHPEDWPAIKVLAERLQRKRAKKAHYKPGDQAPEGYLAWHEWAEAQHKARLRQKQCGTCGLWRYPQELSGDVMEWEARTARGKPVRQMAPLCLKCQLQARHEPANVRAKPTAEGGSALSE